MIKLLEGVFKWLIVIALHELAYILSLPSICNPVLTHVHSQPTKSL